MSVAPLLPSAAQSSEAWDRYVTSAMAPSPAVPQAICHGCQQQVGVHDVRVVSAEGNQCHYCAACQVRYQEFVIACAAEEKRLNRVLDLFIEEARSRTTLMLVPQDLPKRQGLGGLRLG